MIVSQLDLKEFEEEMKEHSAVHIPVMLKEVVQYLQPKPKDICIDCTLGLGGHAQAILNLIGPQGRLIGIDRDAQSLDLAKENLGSYLQQCDFIQDDNRNIDRILSQLNIHQADKILFDLGISSFQLDTPQRGFSIQHDGPLDMRMDQRSRICAYDLINSLSERELSSILKEFGQERWHNRIAHRLVLERLKEPIETTQQLSDVILKAMPRQHRRERIHPATRTFQAFRIVVNRELEAIEMALEKSINLLKPGGRICVLAFHSLEDRIVKEKFRTFSHHGQLRCIVKKPLRPTQEECDQNPRARSARLRIAERI